MISTKLYNIYELSKRGCHGLSEACPWIVYFFSCQQLFKPEGATGKAKLARTSCQCNKRYCMEPSYRKSIQHFNDPGHAHELTFSCYKRLPLLSRDQTRWWFTEAVDRSRVELDYSLLCYAIMPEHVHLIVLPKKVDYNISWFLKRVKQSVSRRAKVWLRENDLKWYSKLTICHDRKKKEFHFW